MTVGSRPRVVGWQCLLDLHGCHAAWIDDLDKVRAAMREAAERAGATVISDHFHRFEPHGISGVTVIAESHVAIHTWPERNFAAIDIFTCSSQSMMEAMADRLVASFGAERAERLVVFRGADRLTARGYDADVAAR